MVQPFYTSGFQGDFARKVGASDAILSSGRLLFISGQVGWDLDTGEIREGLRAQTMQALANIKTITELAGGSMDNLVQILTFLVDNTGREPSEFVTDWMGEDMGSGALAEALKTHAPNASPSGSGVWVITLGHPDLLVETQAIVAMPE